MQFFTRKKLIFLVFILITVGSFGYYWKSKRSIPAEIKSSSIFVKTAVVHKGIIPIEVHSIGSLTATNQAQIVSEISGQVAKVNFKDGDFVKMGTPLIQLDDSVYKAKMISAQAQLAYSESDYHRKKLLFKQGAISSQAVDQAQAAWKEKKAIAQESEVMVAKSQLLAPFDGILGRVTVSSGDYVTPGQVLVSLTDIRHLRAEYAIPEKYFASLEVGQEIVLTTSVYANKQFRGKIAFISPTINALNRTISVYADVENNEKLLTAGMFVNVKHRLGEEKNILLIPVASLVPTIDGQHVFKVINQKVTSIPVSLGHWTQDDVQIVSGLQESERVVVAGQELLKEGMSVNIS